MLKIDEAIIDIWIIIFSPLMNTNEDGHRINDQSFMQGMTVQIRNCSVAWRGIMSCEYIFDPSGVNMQFSDHLFSRTDARTNFVWHFGI